MRYRVRKGDTLGGIADQFSVTSDQVRKWNGLKTAKVSRGMVLRIYTVGGPPETRTVHHTNKTIPQKKPREARWQRETERGQAGRRFV